jgi:hypothetical protein
MIKHASVPGLSDRRGHSPLKTSVGCPLSVVLRGEGMMTKIVLAAALAIAAMSAVPAFAGPHGTQVACTEDLGYGRTGSYGC